MNAIMTTWAIVCAFVVIYENIPEFTSINYLLSAIIKQFAHLPAQSLTA